MCLAVIGLYDCCQGHELMNNNNHYHHHHHYYYFITKVTGVFTIKSNCPALGVTEHVTVLILYVAVQQQFWNVWIYGIKICGVHRQWHDFHTEFYENLPNYSGELTDGRTDRQIDDLSLLFIFKGN
jgi:hypothetical protein